VPHKFSYLLPEKPFISLQKAQSKPALMKCRTYYQTIVITHHRNKYPVINLGAN